MYKRIALILLPFVLGAFLIYGDTLAAESEIERIEEVEASEALHSAESSHLSESSHGSADGDADGHSGGGQITHQMMRLVLQLAIIILAAQIFGFFVERVLKQSRVLGELIAGMIIGPYALGQFSIPLFGEPLFPLYSESFAIAPELYGFAVLASIILLFMSGLETDLPTFLRFSVKGTIVGLGGVIVSFSLGVMVAVVFVPGVTQIMDPIALFLGTLSTATSVGITARILSERKKMSSPEGVTILAAAVFDDVIGIILLAIVMGIASAGGGTEGVNWGEIGGIAAKAFGFWLGFTVIGIIFAPKLVKSMKSLKSLDFIVVISFGLALFMAGISEMANLAMIIGAYVTGLALSQTDIAHEIQEKLEDLSKFLVPIFFCVTGMMVSFDALLSVFWIGLIYSGFAIAGKVIGCGVPSLLTGFNLKGALRIGAGMLPRGEVTLIIAGVGYATGIIGPDIFGMAVMTLLVASLVAPPAIVGLFKGGSGYRKSIDKGIEDLKQVSLDLHTSLTADFMRSRLLSAFRNEEFFVQRMDHDKHIYSIRKDEKTITMRQDDEQIVFNTSPKDEQFVRLMIFEEIINFKDLLEGVQKMGSSDDVGQDLLEGLF